MSSPKPIAPPTLACVPDETSRPITADLDAGWEFADEPAATDGGLLGNPDAVLAEFPPGPSDQQIAALVDEFAEILCRPRARRPPPPRHR